MAQNTVLQLLPQTAFNGSNQTVLGSKQPAAGYYLANKDLQTLSWSITNATGYLVIKASLATDPGNDDWFTVQTITFTSLSQNSYMNIVGNYVWIKADLISFTQGVVNHVKVSY